MSISNILQELWPGITQQQGQAAIQAFVDTQGNRRPPGLTDAQFAELCVKRFVVSVIKGGKRQAHEATLAGEQAQVDVDFPEA